MNDEAARHGRLDNIAIDCFHSTPEDGLELYGGERGVRCPHCGHVSPSEVHFARHEFRECCGRWGTWRYAA